MNIEFKAGQEVWVMKNNQPVQTKIRAVQYNETLEVTKNAKTGAESEAVNTNCVFGTFADPHKPLQAKNIGSTKDQLIQKLFGRIPVEEKEDNS